MPAPQLSISVRTFAAEAPIDWPGALAVAELADTAGVDRLVVSDHVAFGEDLEAYADPTRGGVEGGRQPTGPDGLWLEPLTVLSAIAARTRRIRLGTNILQAALRRPVVLAKVAATLDVISDGRLDLGVGVGWQREEYEAAGLDFAARGDLLDHTLHVCRTLWREPVAAIDDGHLSVAGIHQMPKPRQPGGVPIWVSGTVNRRSMRRLARFGQGWIPWGPDAADLGAGVARMRAAVSELDRDPDDIGVVATLAARRAEDGQVDVARTLEPAEALVAAGATDLRVHLPLPADPSAVRALLEALVAEHRTRAG